MLENTVKILGAVITGTRGGTVREGTVREGITAIATAINILKKDIKQLFIK